MKEHQTNMEASAWQKALELDSNRAVVAGSRADLCAALGRGADLRVYTEWLYEEHVLPDAEPGTEAADPKYNGPFEEVIDFRETYTIGDDYAAGITTLRQSMLPVIGFNPEAGPRMAFFMYDVDGQQGVSSLLLDASPYGAPGVEEWQDPPAAMPKMSRRHAHDLGSLAPSSSFVWEFERYRFWVRDDWQLALAHDAQGEVTAGSWEALHAAHQSGREVKVGLVDLCAELDPHGTFAATATTTTAAPVPHVVFSLGGSSWTHRPNQLIETMTHPLVRLCPRRPLEYSSGCWDVAWVFIRSNGEAVVRRLDPYTRQFADHTTRLGCRWYFR
jgi:hypothetical protein